MSNNQNNKETPGFRNYNEWIEGYHPFKNWIINELECIKTGKPTTTEEEWPEIAHNLYTSLLKGATALQYIGTRDFYHKDENLVVIVRFKQEYKDTPIENRPRELLQDVIKLLESDENQFIRIANAYDQKE